MALDFGRIVLLKISCIYLNTFIVFYELLGSELSPQSCLYFQGFLGSKFVTVFPLINAPSAY